MNDDKCNILIRSSWSGSDRIANELKFFRLGAINR